MNSSTADEETTFWGESQFPETVFSLLSNPKRRAAIEILLSTDHRITLRDLRNELVKQEYDTEITAVPPEELKNVYLTLYHAHIPKLAEAGLITYDQERMIVEPTEKLSHVQPLLYIEYDE